MAYTFALPFRPVCPGPTNFHLYHEQVNPTDQESEYDADVEAVDLEEVESEHEVPRSISSPTQALGSPIIAWQAFKTTQPGAAGVEIAEVDIIAQADLLEDGNWHAVRTPQIEPVQTFSPRSSGWTPINVPSPKTSPIRNVESATYDTATSDTENNQSSIIQSNGWSVTNGSQTDTSQATSVELDKPSLSYPQKWNTLHRHPKKAKPVMKTMFDMPQLKANFRKYKKEYTSASAKEQIKWLKYRIACLDTDNSVDYNFETTILEAEWDAFWERRRWLKQEMLRIKNVYTLARHRRQERIHYALRANYDIAFIKSLAEN
ncbi:hypothetical protein SBOR_7049 [Sclerotinia borealis F-4128]|uniref:Uncharacterized protein n=1 Tax=Sclerotinia borealis (strain F-4128) TaxID=1432307 RepID=W9CCL1_SCLBF|nr:hypothetical protein SBOR_7049 [Sclerotinia borealis F-4128]